MNRSLVILGGLILVIGVWALPATLNTKNTAQISDNESDSSHPSAPKTVVLIELAEQKENQSDHAAALELYSQVRKARPYWSDVYYRIARCQSALGQKKAAANTLRQLMEMDAVPGELLKEARAALQELLLPALSVGQRGDLDEALAQFQAGEELKKHESEDLEIRVERKLYAPPFLKAIELLEKFTKDLPEYAPAYSALGAAHERLWNFAEAAKNYRKFLEFGLRNKLPELEQQAQIRQRLLICERKHQVDVELTKRIPGHWEVSYPNDPSFDRIQFLLCPNGTVKILVGDEGKIFREGAFWRVVARQLIVWGDVGKPSEWCNCGVLAPSGQIFDGLNLDLRPTRYVKKRELERIRAENKTLKDRSDALMANHAIIPQSLINWIALPP
jgi:tetratricopeptide (TPR) repeat protein